MEALLIIFLPLVLVWVGLALISGRSLSPEAVLRGASKLSWQILKWLWRDRRKPGGAGRMKRPRVRYRR